jgi:uncharacterized protein (DUF433 family)
VLCDHRYRDVINKEAVDQEVVMFERITFDSAVMGGRACLRGMRVTVSLVLSLLANQMSVENILADYPYLEKEDILACLQYAVFLASEEVHLSGNADA